KIEREALGLGVAVLFQHFEPIDDGASRADQIVTDARAQKRSEVERFEGDLAGHGLVSGSVGLTWEPAGAPNRGRGVGAAGGYTARPAKARTEKGKQSSMREGTPALIDELTGLVSPPAAANLAPPPRAPPPPSETAGAPLPPPPP